MVNSVIKSVLFYITNALYTCVCAYRYMTALTDSEEELSDADQSNDEQPVNKLSVLLESIDGLHHGTEIDKRESLNILLEQREEVSLIGCEPATVHSYPQQCVSIQNSVTEDFSVLSIDHSSDRTPHFFGD